MSRYIKPSTATCPEDHDETLRRLQSRIEGRRVASELWSLMQDTSDARDPDFLLACIEQLMLLAGLVQPQPEEEKHEPIVRLGMQTIGFGQYKGVPLDDIPRDYLDWLCSETEMTLKALLDYLKHPELEQHRGEYDDLEDD